MGITAHLNGSLSEEHMGSLCTILATFQYIGNCFEIKGGKSLFKAVLCMASFQSG